MSSILEDIVAKVETFKNTKCPDGCVCFEEQKECPYVVAIDDVLDYLDSTYAVKGHISPLKEF